MEREEKFNPARALLDGEAQAFPGYMTIDLVALRRNFERIASDGALDLGGLVEVIGPHQTLEILAADADTIAYEILTGLGHRFRREYC